MKSLFFNFKKIILFFICFILIIIFPIKIFANDEVVEFMNLEEKKIAYLTFDDGPTIYTERILDILNEHEISGIFFVLGSQIKDLPRSNEILSRVKSEGHFIALHTMTHDKFVLYQSEKSPSIFTAEMLELRSELFNMLGHSTKLCRAPYGKKGHFKIAHHQAVKNAGLYCVDWHIDSRDWASSNKNEIVKEVATQLALIDDEKDLVLLFHELSRTADALPEVIRLLKEADYTFVPYVEGQVFDGLE